ncbi:MFS transporter [Cellulomonas sp. NPDC057328]|uniref:MFS transporter n=1 Tax=Cellulomonas sp. NPDC057328 TaxID=3346101 RepID=UPI003630596E
MAHPTAEVPAGAPVAEPPVVRRQVAAWAAWDWGSAAFNAVVTTFVFTVYLTGTTFVEPGADETAATALHSQWLGWGLAAAGVLVALTAPALGTLADAGGRRRPLLGAMSAVVGLSILALWFVQPAEGGMDDAVRLGVTLLAVGTIAAEIASVAYNALLLQISGPRTIGRISGIGWGAGYVGGIVLLLVLYFGFIQPDVGLFGVTSEGGLDVRVSMLVAGAWFLVFAVPVLVAVPDHRRPGAPARVSVVGAYATVGRHVAALRRDRRSTLRFLVASAVFRDGLAGVFTFGGVLAAGTFGFSAADVIVFAIAANVVAGAATVAAGWLDDRYGPRRVVTWSLVVLVVAGTVVFLLHDVGASAFWAGGLVLSACVGPAQSASRALLARLAEPGRETEVFGLYATTGRVATFLAPAAFSTAILIGGGEQYWGILGIVAVLLLGLLLFVPVRFPRGLGVDGRRDVAPATMDA